MPIHVSWGNEQKTYTFFRFEDNWTWEEYHRAIHEASELAQNCPHMVNALVDITECRLFPENLLSHVSSSVMRPPRATDLVVIVTTSRFVVTLMRTMEMLYDKSKMRFKLVKTLQDGEDLLAEYDRLHPISPPSPGAV